MNSSDDFNFFSGSDFVFSAIILVNIYDAITRLTSWNHVGVLPMWRYNRDKCVQTTADHAAQPAPGDGTHTAFQVIITLAPSLKSCPVIKIACIWVLQPVFNVKQSLTITQPLMLPREPLRGRLQEVAHRGQLWDFVYRWEMTSSLGSRSVGSRRCIVFMLCVFERNREEMRGISFFFFLSYLIKLSSSLLLKNSVISCQKC